MYFDAYRLSVLNFDSSILPFRCHMYCGTLHYLVSDFVLQSIYCAIQWFQIRNSSEMTYLMTCFVNTGIFAAFDSLCTESLRFVRHFVE